jgi:hypothetical protein
MDPVKNGLFPAKYKKIHFSLKFFNFVINNLGWLIALSYRKLNCVHSEHVKIYKKYDDFIINIVNISKFKLFF